MFLGADLAITVVRTGGSILIIENINFDKGDSFSGDHICKIVSSNIIRVNNN